MAWNFLQRIFGSSAADGDKKSGGATPRAESPTTDEDRVRLSARRRLIGAGVLVVLTVAIFPWVFESQQKPVNDDLVIEIARKDAVKPLPLPVVTGPAAVTTQAAASAASPTLPSSSPPTSPPVTAPINVASYPAITRIVGDAPATPDSRGAEAGLGRSPVAAVLGATDSAPAVAAPAAVAASAPVVTPAKPASAAAKPAAPASPISAAKPTASAPAKEKRFIVQVGAFAEAAKARDTRVMLELEGYKSYSEPITTPKGKIWRVRIGSLESREKAESVKAKMLLKGFNAQVLEL